MNKPVKNIRAGQVSCALWQNEMQLPNGGSKMVLKATVERRYKDRDGEWKSSNSFGRNEIPLAVYCLNKAYEAIVQEEQSKGEEMVE